MTELRERTLYLVSKIPKGRVTTYKEIAIATGNVKAYRAIGNILASNPNPIKIPCHRVVRSDGNVGGYSRGVKEKIRILRKEGIEIENGVVDIDKYKIGISRGN